MIAARRATSFAIAFAMLAPAEAWAQQPKVTSHASASQVEVGEPFTIDLKALGEQGSGTPSDPELHVPAGILASSPSVSQQTFAQFGNGQRTVQVGIGATWQLTAQTPGHFVIAGPSVRWSGARIGTPAINVDVVPSTGKQHLPPNPFSSPFLMPGGPSSGLGHLPFPFGIDQKDDPDEALGNGAPELALTTAPDRQVFLHAIVDKKNVVVGEQASISFYVYHAVDFEMTERHEASLSDFLRVPLLKNPGADPPVVAVAGGQRFTVRLLDKLAIFPLHAGDLHTGSMTARFVGRHIGAHVLRESEDIVLHVTEPPKKDRPAGYTLGDTGRFQINAVVQPRHLKQGGAVAVTVKVSGTGNLPSALHVPERTGIEWLDPEKSEQVEIVGGKVGGYRTFGYVVTIKESGAVDLGTIDLPHWDPEAQKYVTERAQLGVVDVEATTPSVDPAPAAENKAASDPFANVALARRSLGAWARPSPSRWLAAPWSFGAVVAPPFAVLLLLGGARAGRSLKRRRIEGKSAPATLAREALREATAAKKRGDASAEAAALERALRSSIEGATGLKSRGVVAEALPSELEARGVRADVAARVAEVLAACDAVRFDPLGEGARDLDARVRETIASLGKR